MIGQGTGGKRDFHCRLWGCKFPSGCVGFFLSHSVIPPLSSPPSSEPFRCGTNFLAGPPHLVAPARTPTAGPVAASRLAVCPPPSSRNRLPSASTGPKTEHGEKETTIIIIVLVQADINNNFHNNNHHSSPASSSLSSRPQRPSRTHLLGLAPRRQTLPLHRFRRLDRCAPNTRPLSSYLLVPRKRKSQLGLHGRFHRGSKHGTSPARSHVARIG